MLSCITVGLAVVLTGRPALLQSHRPSLLRQPPITCTISAPETDLVGDGGVLKKVMRTGSGAPPSKGDVVEVHYDGTLVDTGARFDSSRERGKTFKFTLGEGKVIGGWEVGVGSMKPGELSVLTCAPQYAYGDKGIPPIIPPAAKLQFEVELLGVQSAPKRSSSIAEDNPDAPRTPGTIQAAYDRKMASKPAPKEGLEGLVEWAKSIYIFGLFSKTAERPPWYLNPLITFPGIFAVVGVGFWLVVALGGLHRGEVPLAADDLSGFIDETPLPGAPGSILSLPDVTPAPAPLPPVEPQPLAAAPQVAPSVAVPAPQAVPAPDGALGAAESQSEMQARIKELEAKLQDLKQAQ